MKQILLPTTLLLLALPCSARAQESAAEDTNSPGSEVQEPSAESTPAEEIGPGEAETPEAQPSTLQPKPSPMTEQEITESILELQGQVKQIANAVARNSENVAGVVAHQKTLADQLQEVTTGLGQLSKDQVAMADKLAQLSKDQLAVAETLGQITKDQAEFASQLKEANAQLAQVDEFKTATNDEFADLRTQLGQISRSAGGSRSIRFDNIQDQQTLDEFQSLIDRSTPRRGKLIVENKMTTIQYIRINRMDYYLTAGERRVFEVPVGNVSTQLRGKEVINWTVGAPDFEQTIQIVPTAEPAPVTPPIVLPPVSYESYPIYIEPIRYARLP